MRVFFAKIVKCNIITHGLVTRGCLGAPGGGFACRTLSSQEITHDFEDDHPENAEILRKLRQKHHYHGVQQKNTHDVMVVEPDFKWGRHRYSLKKTSLSFKFKYCKR